MDGKRWSKKGYYDPRGEQQEPFADDVRLGELGLYEGQRILYIFDFGDM